MKTKRKYIDEPEADKGCIRLMINRTCGIYCPLCYTNQYDLDTVPVVTVEELKAAHTILLTGGDPFYVQDIITFCIRLRLDNPNIKRLYIYTSGFKMSVTDSIRTYLDQFSNLVDGINFSPKRKADYVAIKEMLTSRNIMYDFFTHTRINRIVLMPNDFMTREQQEEYIESLPIEDPFYGKMFDVEFRDWQEEFKPNGGVWRRLPVFF